MEAFITALLTFLFAKDKQQHPAPPQVAEATKQLWADPQECKGE